jgi:hypothetical protein
MRKVIRRRKGQPSAMEIRRAKAQAAIENERKRKLAEEQANVLRALVRAPIDNNNRRYGSSSHTRRR